MTKLFTILVLMCLFIGHKPLFAQFSFVYDGSIPVSVAGRELANGWAGGLNGVQFQKMDLNNNGVEDLVVFDRTAAKVMTFLWEDEQWQYSPAYEAAFPPIRNWLVLYDYNCDGQKDLFFSIPQGISVYRHSGFQQGMPVFELEASPLRYEMSNGNPINLNANVTDIPALVDADADGDMDILIFAPIIGGTVEFYKNRSAETGDGCGLDLFRETSRWGDFEEAGDCKTYLFDNPEGSRLTHNGASVLLIDLNGDELLDLLVGEMDCENLVAMVNQGTTEKAAFRSTLLAFPPEDPVQMPFFPAAFYEDVNQDGRPDLLVSPNVFDNFARASDFRASSTLFLDQGSGPTPDFVRATDRFLQDDMIDLGERSMPAVADIDGNGTSDLLVGHFGNRQADGFYATLSFFANNGSNATPAFDLVDTDFMGLSSLKATYLNPQFADMDGNGRLDLVLAYLPADASQLVVKVFPNQATGSTPSTYTAQSGYQILEDISIRPTEKPYFYDIDQDGEIDLLIGRQFTGELNYYQNQGNFQFEIAEEAFGGIEGNFEKSPAAFVADLLADGEPDLIVGNESGNLSIYPDFRQQTGAFTAAENIFFNPIKQTSGNFDFGRWVVPVQLGRWLLVGTMGGGLMSFRLDNTLASSAEAGSASLPELKVFPNPTTNQISISAAVAGSFHLLQLDGRQVATTKVAAGQATTIATSQLPAGLYLYRFVSADLHQQTGKLLVIH